MTKAAPWSIKGVDFDVREAAKEAARRDGVSLGEWMNRAIADRAAEIGASAQEFDADERLEAVAAQLALLSRESPADEKPRRRRGETGERAEAPPSQAENADWIDDAPAGERAGRRSAAPERRPGRALSGEAFLRRPSEEIRRGRLARDSADAEALFEQAVAAFERKASRVESRTARAMANVAQMIESSEEDRAGALAQVDARLGEIETRLARRERPADDKSLRGALERLESRIEAMSRQSTENADDSDLRRLDGRLAAILGRLDKVEAAPAGAARDEQFARLEKRFDALTTRLENPAPRSAAAQGQGGAPALKGGIAGAISEIAARQRDLESGARAPRPQAAQLAALLDERFDALARKFDAAGKDSAPGADHIDRLQDGIEALSGRIEAMRRDFAASGDHSRAAQEQFAHELAARVDAALAAPRVSGVEGVAARLDGLDALRRDIAHLNRDIAEAAPRAAVAELEGAVRALADRVDAAREEMIRAAATRPEPTSSAEIDAVGEKVAAMSRALDELAPRSQVAALEGAVRELTARIERSREDGMREAVLAPIEALADDVRRALAEAGASPHLEGVSSRLREVEDKLEHLRHDGGAWLESAVRALADRVDAARDEMIRAAATRPEPTSSAEIDAVGEKVAAMSRALDELAPRSQVAALEGAVRELTARIERSREDGMREAVLAPIESLADDVRRALAEAGASTNLEGVSRQLREVEDKLEHLRHDGGADRADFLQVHDQTEQIRAMLAEAMDRMAPIERLEQQVGALSERLEEVAREARDASAARDALPWSEIEARLSELASRIDRAPSPAPAIDDARFDDLVRRLDVLHESFASRAEDARGAVRDDGSDQIEPLLRSLVEKLSAEPAPQFDSSAIHALDDRIAEISRRLEQGDSEAERRLLAAVEDLTDRLEVMREPGREDRNTREISDLREKTEASDRRAQQTLSAVHETLEKVVDRLAMLEEDVIESRSAAEAAARAPASPANARAAAHAAMDANSFLMEPGAGHPGAAWAKGSPPMPRVGEVEDDDSDFDFDEPRGAKEPEAKPAQANYIDIARRALAARVAAESAEPKGKDKKERPAEADSANGGAGFVRPLAAGEKGANRRLPALVLTASTLLSLGAYEAYRLFDTPAPPMQAAVAPKAKNVQDASRAPALAPVLSAGNVRAASPAPAAPAAPVIAPAAPPNGAPIAPGNVVAPKPMNGAGLPDPLATGSIGAAANTITAIQADAQTLALKQRAEKGDAVAQYDYASRLASGRGVVQDQAAAVVWFGKAAGKGMALAQYRLGAAFEKGIGTPRDAKQAANYYEKAASQGHVRAMHNLGVVLAEGVDGKPDYAAAAQWFRRAAEYGLLDSQFNLAILYARGLGVPQDLGQSYVWFSIAAQQGDASAAKKRDEVAERLNAATLQQARKQVAAFHARTPSPAVNDQSQSAPGAAAAASL